MFLLLFSLDLLSAVFLLRFLFSYVSSKTELMSLQKCQSLLFHLLHTNVQEKYHGRKLESRYEICYSEAVVSYEGAICSVLSTLLNCAKQEDVCLHSLSICGAQHFVMDNPIYVFLLITLEV